MCFCLSLPPLASPSAGHISSDQELAAYLRPVFASGRHTVLLFLQEKVRLFVRTSFFVILVTLSCRVTSRFTVVCKNIVPCVCSLL